MQHQTSLLGIFRAAIYYLGFYSVTIVHSLTCLLVAPFLDFSAKFRFVTGINFFYIFWLRVCCGVKVQVEGRENLPRSGAYVAVANHQSEWETIYFQTLIRPQCVVLKKELLSIPFFGWGLKLLEPIAIDRSQRRGALKQLLSQGKDRLERDIPVLIFPQGTRLPVGEMGKFNKGGAMLAASAGVPVVPLVHDAGIYWPGRSFQKYPGTIHLRIGPPVATQDRSVDEIHGDTVAWLTEQMTAMQPQETTLDSEK